MSSKRTAIVVQGPHYGDSTRKVIREFLANNKDVLIIISSYEADASAMDDWERQLEAEGTAIYIFSAEPPRSNTEFWRTNFANQNLQRLTSYAGLKRADELGIEYCLKIRSDTFFAKRGIIDSMIDLLQKYPVCRPPDFNESNTMRGRLIVSGHATMTDPAIIQHFPPFHIRDHWYFGFTKDVLRFFDIHSSAWNGGSGILQCSPESSMTRIWMKDLGIHAADTIELLARYFIVMDFERVEQFRIHFPAHEEAHWRMDEDEYRARGTAYFVDYLKRVENPLFFTSHSQWERMVKTILQA